MPHLILGGTGTVGSAVVRLLLEAGEAVRVVTRSADKAKQLPAGATYVTGDLGDPETYPRVFTHDIDGAFLLNAVSNTELNDGLCALVELKRAGARRIVYLSVQEADGDPTVPHFASKVGIERAIKESGIPYTILRPSNYYQNDRWFLDVIARHGVYPQPMGNKGVSRVDVGDIATAARNAFTKSGHENRTYTLVGPEPLTGEKIAATWARALGREVRYAGDDLVAWKQAQKSHGMPNWMAYDFGLMYEMFQTRGLIATPAMLDETRTAIGGEPRRYADYVAEAAATLTTA
jgi:uncharacterized protein YbjT (DUF2867 family)